MSVFDNWVNSFFFFFHSQSEYRWVKHRRLPQNAFPALTWATNELEVLCLCVQEHTLQIRGRPACRIRNARVNPSYDGFKAQTNTQGCLCAGILAGSHGQVLLLNCLFGITWSLVQHIVLLHTCIKRQHILYWYIPSNTAQAGKVSPAKLCVGLIPCLGRDTEVLACLQIKHSVPGPFD